MAVKAYHAPSMSDVHVCVLFYLNITAVQRDRPYHLDCAYKETEVHKLSNTSSQYLWHISKKGKPGGKAKAM